jgi:predicted nucleic acid-binding protein
MTAAHVFAETNFLYNIFHMPSKRQQDALALRARFEAGEIKLYVPYLCLQETRHRISGNLPKKWIIEDLLEFHRFAETAGKAHWDFGELKKLLDAATAEVNRGKATLPRELRDFAQALGDGLLHGDKTVFDFLESLELDDDNLKYNDKLILSSVLVKAKKLHDAGERRLYFVSTDSDLWPKADRPKMARYYSEAGLTFIPNFILPDTAAPSS